MPARSHVLLNKKAIPEFEHLFVSGCITVHVLRWFPCRHVLYIFKGTAINKSHEIHYLIISWSLLIFGQSLCFIIGFFETSECPCSAWQIYSGGLRRHIPIVVIVESSLISSSTPCSWITKLWKPDAHHTFCKINMTNVFASCYDSQWAPCKITPYTFSLAYSCFHKVLKTSWSRNQVFLM